MWRLSAIAVCYTQGRKWQNLFRKKENYLHCKEFGVLRYQQGGTKMVTKKCTKCFKEKSIQEFYSRRGECKECIAKKGKKYWEENKHIIIIKRRDYFRENREKHLQQKREEYKRNSKKYKESSKKWRLRNPDKTYEYEKKRWYEEQKILKNYFKIKAGGKCSICGYSKNLSVLEWHHKNEKEKDFVIGKKRITFRNYSMFQKEIGKCILLCCNCHKEKHFPPPEFKSLPDRVLKRFKNHGINLL